MQSRDTQIGLTGHKAIVINVAIQTQSERNVSLFMAHKWNGDIYKTFSYVVFHREMWIKCKQNKGNDAELKKVPLVHEAYWHVAVVVVCISLFGMMNKNNL